MLFLHRMRRTTDRVSSPVAIGVETGQNDFASPHLPGSVIFIRGKYPMSSENDSANATRGSLRLAPTHAEVEVEKAKLPRQFVNFTFYHARPEWRLLSDTDKQRCREQF